MLLLANLGGEFAGINAGAAGTIAAVAADHDGGDVERGALTKIKTPETHQKKYEMNRVFIGFFRV